MCLQRALPSKWLGSVARPAARSMMVTLSSDSLAFSESLAPSHTVGAKLHSLILSPCYWLYSMHAHKTVGALGKSTAPGLQAGLIIRTASKGYLPDKSFVIVTLLATAVLLFSWRALFAALSPKVTLSPGSWLCCEQCIACLTDVHGLPLLCRQPQTLLSRGGTRKATPLSFCSCWHRSPSAGEARSCGFPIEGDFRLCNRLLKTNWLNRAFHELSLHAVSSKSCSMHTAQIAKPWQCKVPCFAAAFSTEHKHVCSALLASSRVTPCSCITFLQRLGLLAIGQG